MLKKIMLVLALIALVAVPAQASELMKQFPASDTYVIHSKPAFNIVVGDRTEVMTCEATLTLKTGEPYLTADGKRRVDLEIVDWHAKGSSELLGGAVNFRMLQGVPTPDPSYVVSYNLYDGSNPQDFPAHAQFAVPYELETPFGTVSGLFGLTEGSIRAFPPKGEIFTMKKGDTAELMAALMPQPVSALSAAGEVTPVNVTVRPAACLDPEGTIQ